MTRRDDLTAAIAKQAEAIKRLAHSKPSAKRDDSLRTNAGTLLKQARELEAIEEPTPTSDGLFNATEDDTTVSIEGGSPGNPHGVTFTIGDAVRWWGVVFRDRVNYAGVRPTLLPGGKVLTDEGRALAAAIVADPSSRVAPPDWNPLGLPVIP